MKRVLSLVVLALVLVSGAALAQQTPAQPGRVPATKCQCRVACAR